jgi:hypothetical protein
MFALLALLCFVIAQFEAALGPVDLLLAGLAFVAAHLLLPIVYSGGRLGRG